MYNAQTITISQSLWRVGLSIIDWAIHGRLPDIYTHRPKMNQEPNTWFVFLTNMCIFNLVFIDILDIQNTGSGRTLLFSIIVFGIIWCKLQLPHRVGHQNAVVLNLRKPWDDY